MRVLGGPEPDVVRVDAYAPGGVRFGLGGGDDVAELDLVHYLNYTPVPHYVVDGGPGRDTFRPVGGSGVYGSICNDDSAPSVDVDLAAGTFTNPGNGAGGSLQGIEDVDALYFDSADLTGDSQDNRLTAPTSCTGQLSGGAGDDILTVGVAVDGACPTPTTPPTNPRCHPRRRLGRRRAHGRVRRRHADR